jgi:hypothetical protein
MFLNTISFLFLSPRKRTRSPNQGEVHRSRSNRQIRNRHLVSKIKIDKTEVNFSKPISYLHFRLLYQWKLNKLMLCVFPILHRNSFPGISVPTLKSTENSPSSGSANTVWSTWALTKRIGTLDTAFYSLFLFKVCYRLFYFNISY